MGTKLLTLLITGVFALAFGIGGIYGGLLPLAEITRNAWTSRDWQPVPATVLHVERETGARSWTRTLVRYRYEFGGRSYESTRIGLHRPHGDNVGSWQDDWYQGLLRARSQGRKVTAWVDPERPQRSVLDRGVRWGLVLFHVPFALLFTAIGAGAGWAFAWILFTPVAQLEAAPVPAKRRYAEDRRVQGTALWAMAVFWCVLSWPMAALVWMEPQPWLPRIVVTLFAAIGLWLLRKAWRRESLPAANDD